LNARVAKREPCRDLGYRSAKGLSSPPDIDGVDIARGKRRVF
jgi:hypothetical protein